MRTALRSLKPTRRLAAAAVTAVGTAGIATTALAGTAHAAGTGKHEAKPAIASAASTAQHLTAQAAHAKAEQAHAKADSKQAGGEEYADNLDGWIREARAIMKKHGIPGSYDGIKRNIIRESAGDPNAVNDWDINAQKGTPSKGLLQVIQPTFDRYHVEGTPDKLTDPVANIVAACNYAADRYGSMDNVNSAY
ncbi:transglycosylase SLT domain-containing protein [Streptomyces sp. 891-h]|uniref:transglycosylase SLT domain-containing protein n=1 Tax=unclassified Streptomyces TaxID=2593676 RepID=UPI001FA9C5D8|nr:transglycosylase SLT domain-containing protein [Streptomyces sp. 891-h]UNZ16314.1 transglycosylase SLT domain-containing protein [Streptomyces sp. 891-h]